MKKVIVIGAGFSGLAAATGLADKGYDVTILEKNSMAGGRARVFEAEGFTFDMGPSWYWMPDIFDNYFAKFNKKTSDYYDLVRLDPSYAVILEGNETIAFLLGSISLKRYLRKWNQVVVQSLESFFDRQNINMM
jgi:phytoene desaturase